MLKYSDSGYCITLFCSKYILTRNSDGEVAPSEYTSALVDTSKVIDLYIQDALYTIEEEGESQTSINGHLSMINKGRVTFPITLFPLSSVNDFDYFLKLNNIIYDKEYKYKYLFSNATRAAAFGAKYFNKGLTITENYALPIIIPDFKPDINKETASINITMTCKKEKL